MEDYGESIISETIKNQIRGYCYLLAKDSDDSDFEISHMTAVEKYSIELAEARILNVDIAVLIALLHDIGRIKNDIFGKGHAEEGAKEAEILLAKYDFPQKVKKTIVRSIYNHNKKKRIHDEYSELIKDADSMSRYNCIPDYEDDSHEFLRNKYARLGKCRITNNDDAKITGILIGKIKELKTDIRELYKSSVSPRLVHQIRIKIRSIRSIIWYIKKNLKSNCRLSMEILDEDLRGIFKNYEIPRKIHVFRKKLKSTNLSVNFMKYLKDSRKREFIKLRKKVRNKHRNLIDEITGRVDFFVPKCEIRSKNKLPENINFRKILKSADADNMPSLHKLRILCKKVMYLHDMAIINFSQKDFIDLLKDIHRNIGLMNDSIENIVMMENIKKKNPSLFSDGQYEDIIEFLNRDNGVGNAISRNLFELNIRI